MSLTPKPGFFLCPMLPALFLRYCDTWLQEADQGWVFGLLSMGLPATHTPSFVLMHWLVAVGASLLGSSIDSPVVVFKEWQFGCRVLRGLLSG